MRTFTTEEVKALQELGIKNTAFDSPRMTVEAFDDLLHLCVVHARIKILERQIEILNEDLSTREDR